MSQIREFHLQLTTGQLRIYNIENINELEEIVRIYTRSIISSITFIFYDTQHQFHNLVLRNVEPNDRFIVEFFHYYNHDLERIDISYEQQRDDYTIVMNVLSSKQNLSLHLNQYIINPFIPGRNTIIEF